MNEHHFSPSLCDSITVSVCDDESLYISCCIQVSPTCLRLQDPLSLFEEWFTEASKGDKFANAVALATVSEGSQPAARMVLMKGFSSEGFTFFTNYGSRKAQELDSTPKAALCFYWRHLNRSVRVEGSVARVTDAESDAYFQSRPRGSQLGAWCSAQSSEIDSRQVRSINNHACALLCLCFYMRMFEQLS